MSQYRIAHRHASVSKLVQLLAHHQVLCYCSLAKPDSQAKNKGLALQDLVIVFMTNLNVLDGRIWCSILTRSRSVKRFQQFSKRS